MAKSLFIALTSPASADSVEDFTTWYEETHIPEVRAVIPSVTEVSRYVLAGADTAGNEIPRFLAVYEIDDADPTAAEAALGAAMEAGRLTMTSALDGTVNPPVLQFFRGI
ncbi:hypothetical protein [Arthrobacter sp. MMS18-M83]|uniref:hypothetical protein n=1 Tax=Arthrobacter sp. MMS18-M83 TaxID=2996261 RepID=UPI00227A24B2|nr:hypothetical protein [Arthrobacter sp. MMS18-M83]WAH97694.1 hypothetical protein OW521_01980 [Arthrobacter sp. MMS18-M83]